MVKTPLTRVLFKHTLSKVLMGVFAAFIALLTLVSVANLLPSKAQAASAKTLNFQARLLNGAGAIVPDGTYNVEFKLYSAATSTGASQGSCTGDAACKWVETRTGANKVTVKAGYLNVYLGAVNDLPSNIWNQQLWLTMNIGGTGASASWDGEMSPRLQLTAVPAAYSLTNYNSATGFSSTLSIAGATGGDQNFIVPDQGAAGTYSLLTTTAANASYIQNSTGGPQTANFNIRAADSGVNGTVGGIIRAASGGQTVDLFQLQNSSGTVLAGFSAAGNLSVASSIDVRSAGSLTIGGGVATSIVLGNVTTNPNVSFVGSGTLSTGTGAISLNGATTVTGTNGLTVAGGTTTLGADLVVDTNTLVVDSTNNRVGISNATPANTFNIKTPTTAVSNAELVVASDNANVGIVIQTGASPTVNAFQVRNSTNTVQAGITATGRIFSGSAALGSANLSVQSGASVNPAAIFRANASQSANLFELQDSSGNVMGAFNTVGNQLTLGRIATSGTVAQGTLVFADGTTDGYSATIVSSTLSTDRKFLLPNTLGTTASPATICVYNGVTSNCPAATGSTAYVWNTTTVQDQTNFYLRSGAASDVVGVLEGANGQTADLLRLNTYNGSSSTTVARFTNAGSLLVASSVDVNTATALNIGATNATSVTIAKTGVLTTIAGALNVNGDVTVAADKTLSMSAAAASTNLINLRVTGDTNPRFAIAADGTLSWGGGAAATDLSIYRNTTGGTSLKTDSNFILRSNVTIGGYGSINSSAQLTVQSIATTTTSLSVKRVASQTASLLQFENVDGVVQSGFDSNGGYYSNGGNTTLRNLAAPTISTASTGTTYYYVVTAVNVIGETLPSTSVGMSGFSTIQWAQVPGAANYKIYRNTSNSFASGSLLLATISNGTVTSYTDSGGATTAGTPPTTTTGSTFSIQTWSGQTANALTVSNASSSTLVAVNSSGNIVANVGISASGSAANTGYAGSNNRGAIVAKAGTGGTANDRGIVVQAGNSSQIADLLQFQDNSGNIVSSINGAGNQLTLGRIAASGTVSQGKILFADGTTSNFGATLQSNTLTASRTINLPDADGTVCLQNSTSCGFALSSGSGSYIQLAPASAQTDSSTNSSVFINKTGASGNILQLQKSGTDVLTVDNAGAATFGASGTALTVTNNARVSGYFGINTAPSSTNRLAVNGITTTNTNTTSAQVLIGANGTTNMGLVVQGSASRSVALAEFQNSDGGAIFTVGRPGSYTTWALGQLQSDTGFGVTNSSASAGNYQKRVVAGTGGVTNGDVVILVDDGSGNLRATRTTTARDTRVYGVATSSVAAGVGVMIAISGNASVTADTAAVAIGDQLVTSSTSGQVTVDNSATTGIVGYATTTKAAGASGAIGVAVRVVNGQANPNFAGNVTVAGTLTMGGNTVLTTATGIQNSTSVQSGNIYLRSSSSSSMPLVIEGANGQTSDLFRINSYNGTTSTTLVRVDSNGNMTVPNVAATGSVTAPVFSSQPVSGAGNSAGVTFKSGSAANGNSGNVFLDAGSASGTAGTLSIGINDASAITIGRTGLTTTNAGALTVSQLLTGQAGATISGGAISLNTTGTANTSIGNATGTFQLQSSGLNVSTAGALSGISGYTQASGNFAISGTGTFGTGTGAISLNGDTTLAVEKTLNLSSATAATSLVNLKVTGDTNPRLSISADGKLSWGSGSGASDAQLYRASAGILRTDTNFLATGSLTVAPAQLSSPGKFNVQPAGATTVGQIIRGATSQSADLIQFQDSSGNTMGAIGGGGNQLTLGRIAASGTVSQGKLVLSDGTTDNFGVTLQSNTLTASRTINLPDEAGTVCLQNSNNCGFALSSTSGNYVQFAPSSAQADSTTNSSIFINKTASSGNILQLQKNGSDVVTVNNAGALTVSQLLTGQAGATISGGAISLNTTGTANTSIGNATGTFQLQSSGLNVSTAGALTGVSGITTSGAYTQSGTSTNTFTGATTVSNTLLVQPGTGNTAALQVQTTTNAVTFTVDTASTVTGGNGRVGIGTGTPGATLQVSGNQGSSALSTGGLGLRVTSATYTDTGTAASGTVATGVANSFGVPTFAASNTGVTYTNGATLYVAGAPAAGTNVSITNPYALYVASGNSIFGGAVTSSGGFTATSGTGFTATTAAANAISLQATTPTAANNSAMVRLGNSIVSGSANGTFLGINAASGFTGDYLNFQTNNTTTLKVTAAGDVTASGTVQGVNVNATTAIQLNGANINTAGTLNNVVYADSTQTISGVKTFSATGTALIVGNDAQISGRLAINTTPSANNRLLINAPYNTTNTTNAEAVITASAANKVPLVVQVASSPTANAFQVQNSSGTVLSGFQGGGGLYVASGTPLGSTSFSVSTGTATNAAIKIQTSASQSADVMSIQDGSGLIHFVINPGGNQLTLGRIAASGTVSQGKLVLSDGTTDNFGVTLQSNTLTASRTINLPDEAGTVCLQNSNNCGFALSSTSGNYVQFAPSSAQADSTTNSSIFINKTASSGNILQLQKNGSDVVTVNNSGSVVLTDSLQLTSGSTTTNNSRVSVQGTVQSSSANQYGTQNQVSFNPQAANTTIYGMVNSATASGSANTIDNLIGMQTSVATTAGYTGSVTLATALNVGGPNIAGSQLFTTYHGVRINNNTTNGGNTSGTITNYQLRVGDLSAAAGAGGTVNNFGINLTMPSGSGAGTTNNYGIYIRPSGQAATEPMATYPGNYALLSMSTSPSLFSGALTVTGSNAGFMTSITNTSTGASGGLQVTNAGTDSALKIVSSGNAGTGSALVFANNTNGTPSGNLIDLRTGGTSMFSVDVTGAASAKSLSLTAANALTLGNTGNTTGAVLFKGSGAASGTLTVKAPNSPSASNNTLTLPDETGTICSTGSVCAGYQATPASGNFLQTIPTTTATNTISPATSTVVGLTVNATTSGTNAVAAIFNQSRGGADGVQINTTNTSGTQTNGLLIARNGAGGTTTNLLNLTNSAGTASNGLTFTGTFGTLISSSSFSVSGTGAVTAVGVDSGTGLLQGTGGLTLTGATSINATGTANTSIGNATGTLQIQSPTVNITTAGVTTLSRNGSGTGDATFALTGVPVADATSALFRIGNSIASGNTTANGGTYFGINAPNTGAGSAADFINFQKNGTSVLKLDTNGSLTVAQTTTTGNIFAVKDSGANTVFNVASNGGAVIATNQLGAGGTVGTAKFSVANTADTIGQVIKGNATQTQNLFQIQDSSNNINAAFNSTGAQLTLGRSAATGTTTAGSLKLNDGTTTANRGVTLQVGTLTASRTITLPDADGTLCLDSGNCNTASSGYIQFAPASAQTDGTANSSIFINKTGTGNLLQFQTSGVDSLTVSNSGNLSLIAGDLRTGGSAAGNIRVTNAGALQNITGYSQTTGAFTLQANAASVISTTTGALDITSAAAAMWSTTTGNLSLRAGGANSLSLGTNGSQWMVINSTGQVGINTNPTSTWRLAIDGSMQAKVSNGGEISFVADSGQLTITSGNDSQSQIDFRGDGHEADVTPRGQMIYHDTYGFIFRTNASSVDRMIIDTSGNVGIGIGVGAVPSASRFNVSNGSGTDAIARFRDNTTDVFTILDGGAITMTSTPQSAASTNTQNITIGTGNATGTTSTAGNIVVDVGSSTTSNGSILIGTAARAQTITIGNSTGGAIRVGQNGGTLQLDGTNFDLSTGGVVTLAGGQASDITTGGTAITIKPGASTTGSALTLQGGNATTANNNGANVVISGGTGAGTGVLGLVQLAPTQFSYSGSTQSFAANGSATGVDSYSTIAISATASNLSINIPTPVNAAIGRLLYVSNVGSNDFTIVLGGTSITIVMKPNSTATLIWNGNGWTAAGASSSTDLQAAYNNTASSAGAAELVLKNTATSNGLTVRNGSGTDEINGGLLEVQSTIGTNLFSVNNYATEFASNGGAETQGASGTTFPASTWAAAPAGGTVTRENAATSFIATGIASVKAVTTAANHGTKDTLNASLVSGRVYQVSFTGKLATAGSSMSTLAVVYSNNGTADAATCSTTLGSSFSLSGDVWSKVSCTFTATGTITSANALIIRQTDATGRTFYIDNLSVTEISTTTTPSNVQIGGGLLGGQPTLFTLDRFSNAPVAAGNSTYYGSMYYDTTTGRIQCYEADGWGACGSSPDNIITLTPEYTGAVLNGTGVGTLTADFCANGGGLTVNTGLCSTSGEARNYYKWTSPQATDQTYSIYVNYKLPSTFKEFFDDNTIKLTALTDNATTGKVTYEIYRKNVTSNAITQCGTATDVTSTFANTWRQISANGNEYSTCQWSGGDYVIFKINVTARSNANVYVENLDFRFTNQ